MTIKLSAESKYGFSGQYIARITGRAARFQFNREFVGSKYGKRNECSSYETDEVGLYEECDVDKRGKKKSYALVVAWKDDVRKLYSDTDDALKIAKRLDGGEDLMQIVELSLEPMTITEYYVTCGECGQELGRNEKCVEHPDKFTNTQSREVPKLKDDGSPAMRIVYTIRSAAEAKKAEAATNVDVAVEVIVSALQALPEKLQNQALKLAKDKLFPATDKVATP